MDIGAWIKNARTAAKLTQTSLAEEMGLTKGNVSAWENNRHEPSYAQMLKICRLTGCPLPGLDHHQPALAANEPPPHYSGTNLRAQTLANMGALLSRVPLSHRNAVAETLAGWAREGGADHWREMLATLLDTTAKRQA